jgi:hypothetical protein
MSAYPFDRTKIRIRGGNATHDAIRREYVESQFGDTEPQASLRAQRSNLEPALWILDCFVGFASSQ